MLFRSLSVNTEIVTSPCVDRDEIDTTVPIKIQLQNLRKVDRDLMNSRIELRYVNYNLGRAKQELNKCKEEVRIRAGRKREFLTSHKKEIRLLSEIRQNELKTIKN